MPAPRPGPMHTAPAMTRTGSAAIRRDLAAEEGEGDVALEGGDQFVPVDAVQLVVRQALRVAQLAPHAGEVERRERVRDEWARAVDNGAFEQRRVVEGHGDAIIPPH